MYKSNDNRGYTQWPEYPKPKIYKFTFVKRILILTTTLVFLFFMYRIYFESNENKEDYQRNCYSELNKEIKGVVSDAYYDDNINVKAFVIYFTNGEKYVNPIFLKSLNGYVEKGDSIYKTSGTFKFEIFKRGGNIPIVFEDTVNCANWFK